MATPTESGRLHANAVSLVPVIFQSIATVGPAVGVAGAIVITTAYAGGSTPLAVLASFVGCLLVASCIGEFSRHVSSAGGLYAYTAEGLGSRVAYVVGWGFMLAYAFVPALLALLLAAIIGGDLQTHLDAPQWVWLPLGVGACLLAWLANYRGVRTSTSLSVALACLEITIFLALAITLIVKAGDGNTLSVFTLNAGGQDNSIGVVLTGIIYAMFGFLGFDAAASLGEEAHAPKKTIRRAVFLSLAVVGVFYTLCYYAAAVYFGPGNMNGFLALNEGDPWSGLAEEVWAGGLVLVAAAILTSALGSANGAMSVSSRLLFTAGRAQLLPRALGTVHPTHETPATAVHVSGALSIVLVVVMGSSWLTDGPLGGVAYLSTVVTILFVMTYILVCISCAVFYARKRSEEWSLLRHLVIPATGAVFFAFVLVAAFGIDFADLGIAPLEGPARWAVPTVIGWLALGVAVMIYLSRWRPERLQDVGALFGSEDGVDPAPVRHEVQGEQPPDAVPAG